MSDYKDDFKTAMTDKLLLKSQLITSKSATPSNTKVMSEALVISLIEEAGSLIGDP